MAMIDFFLRINLKIIAKCKIFTKNVHLKEESTLERSLYYEQFEVSKFPIMNASFIFIIMSDYNQYLCLQM